MKKLIIQKKCLVSNEVKSSKSRQAAAGKKVHHRFVKSKKTLNKYQHLMIRDMAYFEALFNEMLNDKKASVETLEGLKKRKRGHENESSNISKIKFIRSHIKILGNRKNVNKSL